MAGYFGGKIALGDFGDMSETTNSVLPKSKFTHNKF